MTAEDVRALSRALLAAHEPTLIGDEGRKRAAVLLLLYEREGQEHVLFQVRTQQVEHHKGEISLPGGASDPRDGSLRATALRETHEEIGVAPAHVEIFGRLDDVATRSSNYAIAPFVGAITEPGVYPFRTAPREVSQLLEVPLAHLRSDDAIEWEVREDEGEALAERSFRFGEHLIWGATARVVGQYVDLLAQTEAPLARTER
jgi:8-oxo-dGTP pyrophosphatase MutT (NUDIX family)